MNSQNSPLNMQRLSLWTIALLLLSASCLSEAYAQTPTSSFAQYYRAERSGLDKPRFGFSFSPYSTGMRPFRLAPSRFSLMTGGASANIVPTSNRFGLSPTVAGPNLAVLGSGTVGRLTKWTGITSSNSFIGNSTIFEDKNGLVGIGTDTPTSRLTVGGVIESSIGGFKFPDGTIQTTSASGALFGVVHDATLVGNGTAGAPLGVAVPLILSGSANFPDGVIRVTNTAIGGVGVRVAGGEAGDGVRADGGDSLNFIGGDGVTANGGGS